MGKTYLVGGAVRDALLNLPVHERDYVVIGSTPEAMTRQGFRPVGRDFPVFLHPKTHEEYALARTERKISRGHQGFAFYADPDITLEQDLKRRDLTINAMAQDQQSLTIIDPFNGRQDLSDRILRHVSHAFSEDPLRILRVARLRAYLGRFDFKIAPETLELMQTMVKAHALAELSPERIWAEVYRALQTDFPELFFDTLLEVNVLPVLFSHFQTEARTALLHAKQLSNNPLVRFGALAHQAIYTGVLPKEFADLAAMARQQGKTALGFSHFQPEEKVRLLKSLDYLRRPERFADWLLSCQAAYPDFPKEPIEQAAETLRKIDRKVISNQTRNTGEIAQKIFIAECEALS